MNHKQYHGIQILRGLAAASVVLLHSFLYLQKDATSPAFACGAAGVDLFFVISGVVMGLTAQRIDVTEFIARRAIRIYPLWWLFLILKIVTLALFVNVSGRVPQLNLEQIISSWFLVPNADSTGQILPLIVAGWTLMYEVFFYLICATSLLISRAHFTQLTLFFILASVAIGAFMKSVGVVDVREPASILILPIIIEFAFGITIVQMLKFNILISKWISVGAIACALLAISVTPEQEIYSNFRFLYWGIPAFIVVLCVMSLERSIRFVKFRLAIAVGNASYAIYLAHTAIIPLAARLFEKFTVLSPLVIVAVLFILSIGGGLIVHYLIEKPMIAFIIRIWDSFRSSAERNRKFWHPPMIH